MPSKRALVTGASAGIGLELARCFARAGYDLVLVARSTQKLLDVAAELRGAFGIAAQPVTLNLSDPGAPQALFAQIPSCEVLVNNAGFGNNGSFARIDESEMLAEMQLNVVALTQLTRLYLPDMIARGKGRILNLASTAAFLPGPHMAVYYASKAYVLSFSEALAREVRATGVTVTCLCPGATETGFAARAGMEHVALHRLPRANASHVAKAGFEGTMRGQPVVVPGISNKLVALSSRFTPRRLLLYLSQKAVQRP